MGIDSKNFIDNEPEAIDEEEEKSTLAVSPEGRVVTGEENKEEKKNKIEDPTRWRDTK